MGYRKILTFISRCAVVASLGLASVTQAQYHHYQSNQTDDFLQAFKIVIERMLANYQRDVSSNLFAEVLLETKEVNQFLMSVTANAPAVSKSHPISLMYLPETRVNGKEGSTCFIRYNPKKRHELLFGYDRVMTKAETVYYIAAHEFGHCMAFHQRQLHDTRKLTPSEHELIADKVAIAFFTTNGENETVEKILRFNSNWIDKDSVHYHGDALPQYYERLKAFLDTKEDGVSVTSMLDIFHLAQL